MKWHNSGLGHLSAVWSGRCERRSLSRVMSKQGICSRREAEQLVRAGKVKVNGKLASSPDMLVALDARIELVGQPTPLPKQHLHYIVMNKRKGVTTTSCDELGRATVYDDLKSFLSAEGITERLFAVGRLDKDTTGLMLFTNDNDLADFLTAPEHQVPKTYLATLHQPLSEQAIAQLQHGVTISVRGQSYFARPVAVQLHSRRKVELTLTEGKNREVRRLFEALGYSVDALIRIGFAKLRLDISQHPPTLNGHPLDSGQCLRCLPQDIWSLG